MDWQALFDLAYGAVLLLLGAVGRVLWDANKSMRHDLRNLAAQIAAVERALPATYVRRDDWIAAVERIERAVERIETKLDSKADKP